MNLVDQIIYEVDKGLKYSLHNYQKESREYPACGINNDNLSEIERSHSANLMSCLLYTSPSPRDDT